MDTLGTVVGVDTLGTDALLSVRLCQGLFVGVQLENVDRFYFFASHGGVPEWLKGTGCKPVGYAYDGSNPSAPTMQRLLRVTHVLEMPT
jgi:hypothetical protein